MSKHIVTRTRIFEMLQNPNPTYVMHVIGRALVVLFKRQTSDEQAVLQTTHTNHRGFAQNDAKSGSMCALYYIKHNRLEPWMVRTWTQDWKGQPRISKYWKQLDEAASQRPQTVADLEAA